MKRIIAISVISALLVAGGAFAFATVSRAAAAVPAVGSATWLGRGGLFTDTVGELLGLDAVTIMTRRHSGESLAAIAASQGVDEQRLIDTLKIEHLARINDLVTAGRLTEEQAAASIANLDTAIKANVERTTVGPSATNCLGLGLGGGRGAGAGRGQAAGCGRGMGYGRGCAGGR